MSVWSLNGRSIGLRRWLTSADAWPYLLGLIALIAFFRVSHPVWLTNDDVHMSLIADGEGISAAPSPHLVLTNIAWSYLVYWFPDIGGIRSYTWVTYIALAVAYAGTWLGFRRGKLDHRLAALLMLLAYAPMVVEPQFTLLAGYLIAAGLLLACTAIQTRSRPLGIFAGVLVVLSGLVRADETALVLVVASPLCVASMRAAWDSDLRSRWLAIAGGTAAVFTAFWLLDYLSFGSGDWAYFAGDYALRTGFTDFQLGAWFSAHPASLEGSGFSPNDMHLFSNWFYQDTQVFSPANVQRLLQRLPWEGRLHIDFETFMVAIEPFTYPVIVAFCAVLAVLLPFQRRRGPLMAALLLFAAVMAFFWVVGRPGIARIYIPVFVTLAFLSLMDLRGYSRRTGWLLVVLGVIGVSLVGWHAYHRNHNLVTATEVVQAATCSMPRGSFIISWGGHYPLPLEYPVFEPKQDSCRLDYYSFGQFSLAPFALDQLHRHTGGKDFVPAVLAGQSFDIVADRSEMVWLRTYFNDHYSAKLKITPKLTNEYFDIYTVALR